MKYKNIALGEVAKFIRGITFSPNDLVEKNGVNVVGCMRTKNIQKDLDTHDVWKLLDSHIKNEDQYLIEGDLLVSTANSWNLVGKACWVPDLKYKCTFGGFISVLRANKNLLDQKYLYHWFTSDKTQELLRSFGNKTTNISNLNIKRANNLLIPLPPLVEQKRIAAILDKAKEIKCKREFSIEKLDGLAQSIYRRNFGNSSSIKLEEICSFQNGGTPSKEVSEYWAGDIAWISSADIVGSKIQYGRNFITSLGVDNSATNIAPKGTILIVTRTGVGKVAITDRPTAFSQDIVSITLKKGFDINFVCEALKNNLPYFLSHARGATIQGITRGVLASALIPKVDEGSQNTFGKIISAINEKNQLFIKSLGDIESLGSSLQSKAFSGQL